MNQEIITKILGEYDIKNPSKQVKSAIQQFAFKYTQKLLSKTREVAQPDRMNETHLKVAYDLMHNIHTADYQLAQEKHMKQEIKKINQSENELKVQGEVLSVRLPTYALRNSMTGKQTQFGIL